jgi:hypothetical protein
MTTQPSERIVVFVTPAQKLAISDTAEKLGISVSELMRRAVMNFNATSEQVKVAGIIDRLSGPKAPDPLNAALRSVAERAAAREAREASAAASAAARKKKLAAATAPASPPEPAPAKGNRPAENDDSAEENGPAGEDAPYASGRAAS